MSSQQDDMWEALLDLARTAGFIGSTDPSSYAEVMTCVDLIKNLVKARRQNKDRTSDMLTADLQALRAEMKKPLKALGWIHKKLKDANSTAPEYSAADVYDIEICEEVALWSLLGDDDYLTDDDARVALLGPKPDASSPAAGTP